MPRSSEIIVHCGLHKTGTTAIQLELAKHFNACLDRGIYLYNGNNGNASHHALASVLSRNYLKSGVILAQCVENIRFYNRPKTFISSEDFQSILTSPRAMRFFTSTLRASGFEKITFLIYLRNPISYLTSMYLTLLYFQHCVPFVEYFNCIVEDGSYRYKKWKLHFDYQEIAESLRKMSVDFVFRDYHQLKDGNAVSDVLDFLGEPSLVKSGLGETRRGVTKNRRKFTRYCRHILGSEDTLPVMFNVFEKRLASSYLYLPVAYKKQVLRRFESSLSFVDKKFNTGILTVIEADIENSSSEDTKPDRLSYLDVFHQTIRSDVGPVLSELASGKRRALSQQLMGQWGWMR